MNISWLQHGITGIQGGDTQTYGLANDISGTGVRGMSQVIGKDIWQVIRLIDEYISIKSCTDYSIIFILFIAMTMDDTKRDRILNDIKYFRKEKGDLERCTGFDEFAEYFPEIIQAWNNYKFATKVLDLLVDNIE